MLQLFDHCTRCSGGGSDLEFNPSWTAPIYIYIYIAALSSEVLFPTNAAIFV